MPEDILMTAQPRKVIGKQVKALRRSGWIPLTLFGRHVQPSNLQAEERALKVVLGKAGHNRLIKLTMDTGEPHLVIVRDIQREPISAKILHVDLQEISMSEKMITNVPIVLVGTSPAVTRGDALLLHGIEEISVRVLPTDLIPEVQVDVSKLVSLENAIHVRDLQLNDKIEILTPLDEMLAKLIPVKEEKIEEVVPAVVAAEVEVVGKGKKEEEGAVEEGAAAKKEEKK